MLGFWQTYLSFSLLLLVLIGGIGEARRGLWLKLPLCLTLGFLPVNGLPLAVYVRSFTDDLAISSLLLMGWYAATRAGLLAPAKGRVTVVLAMFAVLALLLYPATLGLSYIDPYRYGFTPRPMLLLGLVVTLWFLYCRNGLGVLALALPTLAFSAGLKASGNYWDYLIDPLLAIYSLAAVTGALLKGLYLKAKRLPDTPRATLPETPQ